MSPPPQVYLQTHSIAPADRSSATPQSGNEPPQATYRDLTDFRCSGLGAADARFFRAGGTGWEGPTDGR